MASLQQKHFWHFFKSVLFKEAESSWEISEVVLLRPYSTGGAKNAMEQMRDCENVITSWLPHIYWPRGSLNTP